MLKLPSCVVFETPLVMCLRLIYILKFFFFLSWYQLVTIHIDMFQVHSRCQLATLVYDFFF